MATGRLNALVVDDEKATRAFLTEALRSSNHRVTEASTGREALDSLECSAYDIVFTDLCLPGMGGMDLIKASRRIQPDARVVMLTGYGTIESAVQALRLGADGFLTKPVTLGQVEDIVSETVQAKKQQPVAPAWPGVAETERGMGGMVGESEPMQRIYQIVRNVSKTDATILIQGESGTGKELVARAICENSSRVEGRFVSINCGAVTESLLARELFGHEAESFTGATKRKYGLIEQAHKGTLFLDEISETSSAFQKSLLRFLQEGEIVRVGGVEPVKVDVRLIAATNRDLLEEVKAGRFREDLYYRLNVVPIALPRLSEHREDIPLLAKHFAQKAAGRHGLEPKELDESALAALAGYDWPGNVRQLENIMERALLLTPGPVVTADDLPEEMGAAAPVSPVDGYTHLSLKAAKESFERSYLRALLERTQGNVSQAARMAKVGRPYFHEKIRKYGIESAEFRR